MEIANRRKKRCLAKVVDHQVPRESEGGIVAKRREVEPQESKKEAIDRSVDQRGRMEAEKNKPRRGEEGQKKGRFVRW